MNGADENNGTVQSSKDIEVEGEKDKEYPGSDHSQRYSRQERFAPFGREGQKQLLASHVLVVGAGALGSAVSETLVRAGVGRVTIADRDYVEWSNLQRQQLFTEQDAEERLPKAIAAQRRLSRINSGVEVIGKVTDVRAQELAELSQGVHVIMDATDNFETRLIINDIAYKRGIPWIYGGCVGSSGMSFTFLPEETPCLNCLLGTIPMGGDTCDVHGILPQAVQMVAAHQTMEAMKLLAGQRHVLRKKMLSFDVWRNERVEFGVERARRTDCPTCGEHPVYPYLSAANVEKSEVLCGRDTVQIRPARPKRLALRQLAEQLNSLREGNATATPYMVMYRVNGHRLVIFEDGRTLIHGTSDIAAARTLYNKYVGG
ncbi:molybdopterin/thiamine biosynthesis adenylyltransferase [Paenibacillus lactis]|uniref:UBA/THIF-type NAD/FAD binding protein n=2 Tax=Paenibacillus lactis TaxID=228574 RepID=G4HFR6_9BACL|nr:ThiF family adenylyltransferase [Paenibacillus lactis]EHB64583.1 UBA/THIF-type NAD/FAD binding protein [Paenibacillus lactis 154]MBP1892719.1 molybdopterin/thiamine biosynthesis adenylyltransferase [Paenibacillus lactis]